MDLRAEVEVHLVGQQAHLRWPTHQGVIYPMLVSGVGNRWGGGGGGGGLHSHHMEK